MKVRLMAAGLAGAALALTMATPATAANNPPHPAPLGPQRPYEARVDGPVNIEGGYIEVARLGTGLSVTFDGTRHTASGEKPAAPREFVFLFDRTIRFNPLAFPTCSRTQLTAAACPTGSKVGTGLAEFYPAGTAEVAVYNTKFPNGLRGVLITIPATGTVLDNTLEPVVGTYQRDYTWGLHEIVPPDATPPELRGSTTRFLVTFGASWQGRDFVESHAPTGGQLNLGIWSHYVTGQKTLTEGSTSQP